MKRTKISHPGNIKVNTQAHKFAAEAANHLVDASQVLTTPGIVTLADSMMRPLVGVHLSLMEEAQRKHKQEKERRAKLAYNCM